MTDQGPIDDRTKPSGNTDADAPMEQARPRFTREWFFGKAVHEHAVHHGWRPFHVEGFRVVRGRGFPDLAMFRQDPKTGSFEMLVAELKRNASSEFGEGQEDWLTAFKQMGITTKVWRADNEDDLEEMYSIIEKGTAEHDSVTELPPSGSTSPIPANFGVAIENTIESIESPEMTTGDKASLRRMDPANPSGAAFWRLMSQRGMPTNAGVEKWGLIIHGIVLMAHGTERAHQPSTPVGRALYLGADSRRDSGFYSESRLNRLLTARGQMLQELLARLFRMLANKGSSFNWREMAWFILNEGHNEEEAEKARMQVAREYYRAQRRYSATDTKDQ